MTVYTDGFGNVTADCLDELHIFARFTMKLDDKSFSGGSCPHYVVKDLSTRRLMLRRGAVQVNPQRLYEIAKRIKPAPR